MCVVSEKKANTYFGEATPVDHLRGRFFMVVNVVVKFYQKHMFGFKEEVASIRGPTDERRAIA